MVKIMIMYFSISGMTRQAALELQQKTKGELFEIKSKIPYPDQYEEYVKAGKYQLDNDVKPELEQDLPDLSGYDLVFLGFPTWWQQPPMIIHTVLDNDKLNGKTIVPFTTSMKTGIEDSMSVIREITRETNLNVEEGFRFEQSTHGFFGKLNLSNLI